MTRNSIEILSAAIANKRRVLIRYKDQPETRVIEPHILYRNRQNRYVVESYQVRGYSSGGRAPPFWRPFRLKRITDIRVLDELFNPRLVEGFPTIRKLVHGQIVSVVDMAVNDYFYFDARVYGPPKPEQKDEPVRIRA